MKDFPWRAGMRDTMDRIVLSVHGYTPTAWYSPVTGCVALRGLRHSPWEADAQPDPNDGATKGALLDVVRESWSAPLAQVTPWLRWDPVRRVNVVDGWRVCLNDATDRRCPPNERAESEFAALLAAYQESP